MITLHNFNGHLSTFQTMSLRASVTNVIISESDPVQVQRPDELVTELPDINDCMVTIPVKPGWGTDPNESALKK